MATIRSHAADFIRTRLAPANPPNDGRQTPMRGHPVFKAQHATATCCRSCLEKWWKIPKGTEIPPERQSRIVDFLMIWIERMQNTQQTVVSHCRHKPVTIIRLRHSPQKPTSA
jgi:hypothetical protein